MRFVLVLFALLLIATGLWYFITRMGPATETERVSGPDALVEEDIVVTKTDITQGGVSKLPVGFPKGLPVEVANITESYRTVYAEHDVTQYTVSYTSQKSRDDLWTSYNDYMKDAGFVVNTSSSKSGGQISGQKAEDTFSAVISSRGGISLVQLNLLDREK